MLRLRVRRAVTLGLILFSVAWGGAPYRSQVPKSTGLQANQGKHATLRNGPELDQTARARDSYGKLPLGFELNRGQTDPQVKFLSRGPGYILFLTATDAVMSFAHQTRSDSSDGVEADQRATTARTVDAPTASQRTTLRMRVLGANQRARVNGRDRLPGKVNYFRGNDPTRWRIDIPTFARVRYEDVYSGIDLIYYGNQRQLEYDFVVAPGADPGAIALTFDGADKLELDGNGSLILHTAAGQLTQRVPRLYQEIDGVKKNIPGRYSLDGAPTREFLLSSSAASAHHVVRFDVGHYDRDRPLVIDPVLVSSTYLGGSSYDVGSSIAVDSAGNAYVTGTTQSSDFPTTLGAFDTTLSGNVDIFVTKLEASGTALAYSTYLGGADGDEGRGIAVDSAGSAYVTGRAYSSDFPTTPGAFDTTLNGGGDVFVTKLEASGGALTYSTYLGGASYDEGRAIAVDSAGSAYVTGRAYSSDFPTTPGAFDTTLNGGGDVFVTKLEASGGALAYSTYIGGAAFDQGTGIVVDTADCAYVTGDAESSNFPTTPGAFDTTFNGGKRGRDDAFVTKLEASGGALIFSTYLGGAQGDHPHGIAIDSAGNSYVTGETASSDFPTTPGAFDTTFNSCRCQDGFVTKLDATGAALVYSTFLGGSGARVDIGSGIAVDSAGSAYVTGYTASSDFPTTAGAFDRTLDGGADAFVTKLEANGATLVSSSYLGGAGGEVGNAIAIDSAGSAYVTGYTTSIDFPTTPEAFDTTIGGFTDAFVTKFDQFDESTRPDLVVTTVSDPPAVLLLTQTFAVSDSTKNQGDAATAKTTTRYYLSGDTVLNDGDKLLSGGRVVPGLQPDTNSTDTVNVSVPKSTKLGVYYLLACADELNGEIESNEMNNCRSSSMTVDVRSPDLVETAVSNPPATAKPGDSILVTDTASNQGNADAGPTTTRYYLSKDKVKKFSDSRLGTRAVPALAAGTSSTGTITVTIPAHTVGNYYLIACADDLKQTLERNENNNCKASKTTVAISP